MTFERHALIAAAGWLTASLLVAEAAAAGAAACRPVTDGAGFDLLVAVAGKEKPFHLVCRDGRLTVEPTTDAAPREEGLALAVVDGASVAGAGKDGEASADGSLRPSVGSVAETAANVAGVSGQAPAASITEAAAAPADGTPSVVPWRTDPESLESGLAKPPVSAAAASAAATAEPENGKSEGRIDPWTTQSTSAADENSVPGPAASTTGARMILIPAPVIDAAELALPGATFSGVTLSREGSFTIYGLLATVAGGRAAAVEIDQASAIRKVDREVEREEVPGALQKIADAFLPAAEIERVMLSSRDNFRSFFVFAGKDAKARPFELEIRSDGRSVRFLGAD